MVENGTYFYDTEGNRLGSDEGLLPITLYKGMKITIHGYPNEYEVVDWEYRKVHSDEEAGLKIILSRKVSGSPSKFN